MKESIDSFWVEATLKEAVKSIFPFLTPEAIDESKLLANRYMHVAKKMAKPVRPYCFLVSRDLSSIAPYHVHYPVHHMWNAYSPFGEFEVHHISDLNELNTFIVPQNIEWVGIR